MGCRPGDVLSVPAPAGVVGGSTLQNQIGAESAFNGAKGQLFNAADGKYNSNGLLMWSGLLTDEFTFSGFAFFAFYGANIDARVTEGGAAFTEGGDGPWGSLLLARSGLLVALPVLAQYEPASSRSKIGEAYALVGYAELLIAESYCAGTPLDAMVSGGGIHYGTPLTTDSLSRVAQVHFDSAVAEANGDATVLGLASVGLGRALMDRGQYAAAATAVINVPTSFVYNVTLEPNENTAPYTANIYGDGVAGAFNRIFNVADQEGGNGMDFISARDPRLVLDSTSYQTQDGTYGGVVPGTWYLPLKFEDDLADIPLATGIEARLIEAESQLPGNPGTWLTDLNTLRNSGCSGSADSTCTIGTGQVAGQTTGLLPLTDPGTDSGRVSLMFRERAFWLFGTGTRLGDLRRLIRQYQRDQSAVFPTGPYANGNNPNLPTPLPTYGTDVDLTLPTPASGTLITNPSYKGCLTSTKVA
jgi:hypothetical protein